MSEEANKKIQESTKNHHYRNLNEKIKKFLQNEDRADLLIIKSHLLCEYYLNQILVLEDKCEGNKLDDLRFKEKLDKALDTGRNFDFLTKKIVGKLNSIRNKIGHELEYQLSESDLDKLGFTIGKDYLVKKYELENDISRLKYCLEFAIVRLAASVNFLVDELKEEIKK